MDLTNEQPQITFYKDTKVPFFVIRNTLSEEELEKVYRELEFLKTSGKLNDPKDSGSATEDGKLLKSNKSIALKEVYNDPRFSDIVSIVGPTLIESFPLLCNSAPQDRNYGNWFMDEVQLYSSATLVSYYEDGDYYEPHRDNSVLTAITFIAEDYKNCEDQGFQGGDVTLPDFDVVIPFKHNCTVIFPGFIRHAVTKVSSDSGLGRFSIVNFGGAGCHT